MLDGLESALTKIIDGSGRLEKNKEKLRQSLHKAVLYLKEHPSPLKEFISVGAFPPVDGGDGDRGGDDGRDDWWRGDPFGAEPEAYVGKFKRHIKWEGAKRCLIRNAILLSATVFAGCQVEGVRGGGSRRN